LGRAIDIFADAHTINELKREFMYVFAEKKYPGIPELVMHEIKHKSFKIGSIELQPIPVMHYKLPVLGFRIGNFAYITDANYISEASMKLLEGVETLVLNALRIEPHISHFTLAEAIEVVKLLQPKNAYFTHISHLLGKHEDINNILPKNIQLAYDGLKIDIS
jgi:phosphoribosyl 1,2-cyclic phosphate phosphodiesterase